MPEALIPAPHTIAGLDQAFEAIGRAGGWFSAAERVAIARETRAVRDCALCRDRKTALSPNAIAGSHDTADTTLGAATLNAASIDAIHRITSDPGRLSQTWYDAAREQGLEPEEVVELTSIVGVLTIADTYAHAMGLPERPLPEPQDGGTPHRTPLSGTTLERGWVPMVEPDSAEGMTKMFYAGVHDAAGFVFNVARALSSVPEALRDFFGAFFPNYSTHGAVREGGLTRVQVELLASTTSAHNDCFY